MRSTTSPKSNFQFIVRMSQLMLLVTLAVGQGGQVQESRADKQESNKAAEQIHIPNRAPTPLFKGAQGKQKTEIQFDPATRMVTMKLLVQDPNSYFIPNIRRENFVVYENRVHQQIAAVEIEHASVSLGLLMEFGGRTPGLNRLLGQEVSNAGRQLLQLLDQQDKLAVWKYGDKVEKIADFSQPRDRLESLFYGLGTPEFSESNLYDALILTLDQMSAVPGRKAIILISSGSDSFSKASYQDALKAAGESDCPIYVISIARTLRDLAELHGPTGSAGRVDWEKAEKQLQEIARASGGRAYSPETTVDLSAIYDDVMENLKVRYVITYHSSIEDMNSPRTVRVELVNPTTGKPLQIVDSNGRTVRASVLVQSTYLPNPAFGR
jgi:VWFA-related protein